MGLVEFSKVSNIKLITEGVETFEKLETLIGLGVQYGQGYYFQRPDEVIKSIKPEILGAIQEINTKFYRNVRMSISNPFISSLVSPTKIVSPDKPVLDVDNYIRNHPDTIGVCIVEKNIPLGTISREKLGIMLSGQYGFNLYQKKNISEVMDCYFLSVDRQTWINVVSSLAMARTNDKLYDFIVVTDDDDHLGTVTIKTLLEKSNEIEITSAKHQTSLNGLPD